MWLQIQLGQIYDNRWQPAVAELRTLAGLDEAAFIEFGRFFVLHPAHAGREFSATRAGQRGEDADLTQLFAHLLQQVSDPSRPVELLAGPLAQALGWEGRLRTTFNHELVVDRKKYQPLAGTLAALDARLHAHAQGYLFLAGSPGSGKSTLLTEWARTRPERVVCYYAFDFANPSSLQNCDERGDSTQLFFDLVQQLRTEGFYPANTMPHRDLLFLRQTFVAQLQSLSDDFRQTGRRTLLIIDGLDHVPRDYRAATKSFLRDLPAPVALPEGVYIVLGSQTYELADLPLAVKAVWQQGDRNVQMEPLGRLEVERYCAALRLEPPLTSPQQQLLLEKSQGHPLYLSYLCERLQSGDAADQVLAEAVPIGGDINSYYRRLWQAVGNNEGLMELLGLLARISGAINPEFVREWNFAPAVLQAFRQKVRFLFTTSPTEWAFFHNSFRQFLRQQTAPDYLADGEALDARADADYHRRLADYYHRSRAEYAWHASYHLYRAGEQERFLASTTPEKLNQHLADFRPSEEVRRDLSIGVELARQRSDVALLTRYLLAMSELGHREFNLHLPDLVEELLALGRPAVARNYLRNGRSLRADVRKSTALRAAGLFYHRPEGAGRAEAAVLFSLGEPASIRPTSIVVEEDERFDEAASLLEAWVAVAPNFYPVADILSRLARLEVRGRRRHRSASETTSRLRRQLLAALGLNLIAQHRWADLSLVTQSLLIRRKADRALLLKLLREAIEESRSVGRDPTVPAQFLATLLGTFEPASTTPTARLIVANLLYKVTGNAMGVVPWITGLELQLVKRLDLNSNGHLGQFMPLILLYKLQCLTNSSVPVTVAVPAAEAAEGEALLVDFQRMLCLLGGLLADGASGATVAGLVPVRIRPLVRFYYQNHDPHHPSWYQISNLRNAYFDLLVAAVAGHGPTALQQLTQFLLGEFVASPDYWPADVQRRLLLSLHKQGIAAEVLAPPLQALEPELLVGRDVPTRLEQCQAQARAWLRLGDATAAEAWLRRALSESFGVGYRKDYQFEAWLDWLGQFLRQCPEQAPQMLGWFVARLPYLEEVTEGKAYRYATEKVLRIALNWNLAAGRKLLSWQLREGRIDAATGMQSFLTTCLPLAQTAATYGRLVRFYAELVLLLTTKANSELLEKMLATGQAIGGRDLLAAHLPGLLVAIERRALQKSRAELLTTVDDFMLAQGYRTTDFHAAFVRPPATAADANQRAKNELVLPGKTHSLSEADVIARAVSFDELRQLVQQAGQADSFFKWGEVLEQVGPALSGAQLAVLASVAPSHRQAEFLASLSHLALRKGERKLALSLAEQSVTASAESGWATYFDGGSRLAAFAALNAAEPDSGPKRAFDVFAKDLSDGNRAGIYAEYLEEILPLLTPKVPFQTVWAEVFAYLQRLLQGSRPLTELPDLTPEADTVDEQAAEVLLYLAQHLLSLVQQRARYLLAANLAEQEPASLARVSQLAARSETAIETFVEVVQLVPAPVRQQLAAEELRTPLQQLATAPDYWVRRQARLMLSEAAIPLPTLPVRLLPADYASSRISPLLHAGSTTFLSRSRNAENRQLIRPFGHWLPALAEQAGLAEPVLAQRLVTLMHALDQPENWTRVAETRLWGYAQRIGLEYSHPNPRAETARRALMRVTTELLDSGTITEEPIYRLFTFRDYQVYHLPEITRPAMIPTLGRHERQEWVAEVAQHPRLAKGLQAYGARQIVIGEYTQLTGLTWGSSTEAYQMHLTVEAQAHEEDGSLFGSVFQELTEDYYDLPPVGRFLLVRRDHRFNQFELKSKWLAFNPSLAHQLGWQPDPTRLFAWQSSQGEPLVESVYWMEGNPAMRPYQRDSEVGEGWLVLASPTAVEQLHQLGEPLLLEKKITRSRIGDEARQQMAYAVSLLPTDI